MIVVYLFVIIFAIFEIALMFKIWGACNNIYKLKEYFIKDNNNIINDSIEIKELEGFKTNDTVILKGTNKQFKIIDIIDNKLLCSQNDLRSDAIYYYPNEVIHFSEYIEELKNKN